MILKSIVSVWLIIAIASLPVHAQVYYTKNGHIDFFSKTVLENISAGNNQVISVLNTQTGEIKFSLLNRAFNFPKAKMEVDFNENYMESNQWPRSTFAGQISGFNSINFEKNGNHAVTVTGELSVHGITKKITVPGVINIKDGKISASSTFKIWLKDYKIKIPSIVSNKIAESVEVTVDCSYQKK